MIWAAFFKSIQWALDKTLPTLTGVGLLGLIILAAQESYCWIVAQAMTWLAVLVGMVAGWLPPGAVETIAAVSQFFPIIAAWFPVVFLLQAFLAYQIFALAVICYRFLKSYLPALSG